MLIDLDSDPNIIENEDEVVYRLDHLVHGYSLAISPNVFSHYRPEVDPYTFEWLKEFAKQQTIEFFSQWVFGSDYDIMTPKNDTHGFMLMSNGKRLKCVNQKITFEREQSNSIFQESMVTIYKAGFQLTLQDGSHIDVLGTPIIFLKDMDMFLLAKLSLA